MLFNVRFKNILLLHLSIALVSMSQSGCLVGGSALNSDPQATLNRARPAPSPSPSVVVPANSFSDSWAATTPANFTYNGSLVSFSGANADVATTQFVDNSAATFNAGTHSATQWNAGSSWVELTAPTGNTTGTFSSRIVDAGHASATWSTFSASTAEPIFKPLPNNGATETAYTTSNISMTSNTLLLHLDETSISGGGVFDGADGSGAGNPATAVPIALTSAAGRFKNALSLQGGGAGLKVAHSTGVDPKTNFGVSFWFSPAATFSTSTNWSQTLLDQGTWGMRLDHTDGKLKSWIHSAGALAPTTVLTTALPLGWGFHQYSDAVYYGVENSASAAGIDLYICIPGANNRCDSGEFSLSYASAAHTAVRSFATFVNKLYLGMGHSTTNGGGDIFVCANTTSGGNTTVCDNAADFATSYNDAGAYLYVTAMTVYRDALYAAFDGGASGAAIFRCTSPAGGGNAQYCDTTDWTMIYSIGTGTYQAAISLSVFNDRLYAGMGTASGQGDILICNLTGGGSATACDHQSDWVVSYNGAGTAEAQVNALTAFNGNFYAGMEGSAANNGKVLRCNPSATSTTTTCETGDWSTVSAIASHQSVESLISYGGKLYAAFGWNTGLGDLYACTPGDGQVCASADWTSVYAGSGSGYDTLSSLFDHNGYLYVATGNGASNAAVLRFGNPAVVLSPFTSWNVGTTYHVAITYNGTTLSFYRNGTFATSTPLTITPATANVPLFIGKALGARGESSANEDGYHGIIDEVAIFERTLSAGEIYNHYKRGALRLKYQVRSCNDAVCAGETWIGSDGSAATFFSEETNTSITPSASYAFTAGANRFFQYQATLESNISGTSPTLNSITVSPVHYDSTSPTLTTTTGISFTSLTGFSETLGPSHSGSVTYQLSPDGATWYYWTGATWTTATGVAQSNSAAAINSQIALYHAIAGGNQLFIKTFLTSADANLRPQWQAVTATGLR